jgi:hypothetical protein
MTTSRGKGSFRLTPSKGKRYVQGDGFKRRRYVQADGFKKKMSNGEGYSLPCPFLFVPFS